MQPLRRNLTNFLQNLISDTYTNLISALHKSHFWRKAVTKSGKICPQYSENENYLLGIPELGVVVSEGMRTILWDLDRNAGDMPFKFDCLLLFSLFSLPNIFETDTETFF